MDYPLESLHPFAFKAAVAANCAGDQGKYWEMHDRLFANQQSFGQQWTPHAQAIGIDTAKFDECMKSGSHDAALRKTMAEAQKYAINGTPTFFLAYADPKSSKLTTVMRLTGAQPYSAFKTAIDKLLAGPPAPSK